MSRLLSFAMRRLLTDPKLSRCQRPLSSSHFVNRLPRRLLTTMAACVPCYPVDSRNIQILEHPKDFFQALKDGISSSTRQITMAALYLGSEDLEKELVECLQSRMDDSEVDFLILLDHARGTRGDVNSCTILQKLVDNFPDRAAVALFHTPQLRGMLKSYLPGRLTESVGLNHIKVFVFDDDVLISGANLSTMYFTNRQDRYMLIKKSPGLAEFFHELIRTISTFSLELRSEGLIQPHKECPTHPFLGDRDKFIRESRRRILNHIQSQLEHKPDLSGLTTSHLEVEMTHFMNDCMKQPEKSDHDTFVYPLVQMGPFNIRFDELAFKSLLQKSPSLSRVYLASGYFNLTRNYVELMKRSLADYSILAASPEVNGFYGAKGMAGTVPDVYTQVCKQFCQELERSKTDERITVHEYFRKDWTFHVKGLWYHPPGSSMPTLTMIGSPNFGYRSVHRDLEAQLAIVTSNEDLQERLNDERERLYEPSKQVDSATFQSAERKVPHWVRLGTWFLKSYF